MSADLRRIIISDVILKHFACPFFPPFVYDKEKRLFEGAQSPVYNAVYNAVYNYVNTKIT